MVTASIKNLRRNTARGTSGYTHTRVKSPHAVSRMVCFYSKTLVGKKKSREIKTVREKRCHASRRVQYSTKWWAVNGSVSRGLLLARGFSTTYNRGSPCSEEGDVVTARLKPSCFRMRLPTRSFELFEYSYSCRRPACSTSETDGPINAVESGISCRLCTAPTTHDVHACTPRVVGKTRDRGVGCRRMCRRVRYDDMVP